MMTETNINKSKHVSPEYHVSGRPESESKVASVAASTECMQF
jgi:hypothetical protein